MIELRAKQLENGKTIIVDQHGNRVKGVREVARHTSIVGPTYMVVDVLEYVDGKPFINKHVAE